MSAEQKPYPQLPSTKCALSTLCDVVDESRLWNKGQKCVHFESNPQAENLVKWFTENGGCVHPHVQLVHDDSRGFHVRATRTLDSPTAVVSCPLKLTLSHLNLDPNQTAVKHIDSPLQKCLQTIPSHVLANLLLIEQRALGEASPWFPYIACLPETFNTPLYFSVDDIKCLDGTNLIQAVSDRRELWIQEWTDAYTALEKAGLNDFPCDSLSYKWAATVMTSRAFISAGVFPDMPPFSILFPVVDSLNHAIQAKVDWEFEPLKLFTLKTLYDIYPGDEVLNNYAPKQNAELLMGYGFCIPDHPYEQFEVTVQVPAAIRPLLESSKIPFDMPACSIRNTDSNRQFFRMRDHPFGRYENLIPCLRGVPPLLVFVSYLIALHRRGISPEAVSVAHPGARIVVAVVQQIITGVKASFDRLTKNHPEHLPKTFENQNQKYANMYRIGQVKVVDAIHSELNEFMNTVAFDKGTVPPTRPVIITTTEALALLKEELPDHYDDFTERVSDALDVDLINMEEMSSGRYNFAGLDGIPENDCEDMIWILWLIVGYALTIKSPDSLIRKYILDFHSIYPLPESQTDNPPIPIDAAYDAVNGLLNTLSPGSPDTSTTWNALHDLDSLGDQLREGPVQDFRTRVIWWAMYVVQTEAFRRADEGCGKQMRYCIYMRPYDKERSDEGWIFEEGAREAESRLESQYCWPKGLE